MLFQTVAYVGQCPLSNVMLAPHVQNCALGLRIFKFFHHGLDTVDGLMQPRLYGREEPALIFYHGRSRYFTVLEPNITDVNRLEMVMVDKPKIADGDGEADCDYDDDDDDHDDHDDKDDRRWRWPRRRLGHGHGHAYGHGHVHGHGGAWSWGWAWAWVGVHWHGCKHGHAWG